MKVNEVLKPLVGWEEGRYWLQHNGSQRAIETKNVGDNLEITHRAYVITINSEGEILNQRIVIPTTGVEARIYAQCDETDLQDGMKSIMDFLCKKQLIIFN